MSFGAYFLEPISYKGGETDPHCKDTLWFDSELVVNQYGAHQKMLVVRGNNLYPRTKVRGIQPHENGLRHFQ